ncbi:hypothetical protein PHLCEN_2v6969 [Hermanssonia centrifuga]|uniref:Uncharacterized protein n=1 Tax=Hermanssonia centrifuga TaxID=98765 RepID=A0A2R6NXY4_9APHY|nr:hypothetical protein PHLCEN_2v6969 [Hermanssonia centrifuga]
MNPALSFTFTENPRSDIVTSLCQAIPSFLLPWQVGSTLDDLQRIPDGAAVGCEDGSLYFFRSVNTTSLPRRSSTGSLSRRAGSSDAGRLASALSSRHLSQLKLRTPRSSSPASTKSTFSPFQLTKSRVVSSVSAEQVEAPKNYVDFEDEQEKLKGLIKRRGVKDKNVVDSLGPGVEITLIPEKSPGTSTSPSAAQSISDLGSKEFPSFARSRASSTESLSSPSSPTAAPFVPYPEISDPSLWSLICHTVPPRCGPSEIITAMKALEARHMIVCLHQSGYVKTSEVSDRLN